LIGAIYRVEAEAKEQGIVGTQRHLEMRQARSRPLCFLRFSSIPPDNNKAEASLLGTNPSNPWAVGGSNLRGQAGAKLIPLLY
jgi:hypothetical protein